MKLTVDEFLEWEKHQEVRHEFIEGQVFAMVGTTMDHNRIAGNIHALLHAQLRS